MTTGHDEDEFPSVSADDVEGPIMATGLGLGVPGLIEAVPAHQMAMMLHQHTKELVALVYDKDKRREGRPVRDLMKIAANVMLHCFDGNVIASVFAEVSAESVAGGVNLVNVYEISADQAGRVGE